MNAACAHKEVFVALCGVVERVLRANLKGSCQCRHTVSPLAAWHPGTRRRHESPRHQTAGDESNRLSPTAVGRGSRYRNNIYI